MRLPPHHDRLFDDEPRRTAAPSHPAKPQGQAKMVPLVIVVGADKGGVGKTTVSRCLIDYLRSKTFAVRAFDTQWPNGDLVNFNAATVVDIASIEGQMAVFDGVNSETITVVDICAGQLSPTIRALDDAQLLSEVRSGAMRLVLLHVLGPAMASINEVAATAQELGGATHLLVKNHINKTRYSLSGIPGADEVFAKYEATTVTVPQLVEAACEKLQEGGGSFLDFANGDGSRVLRGNVGTWLGKVWAEFDRVKVIPD